MTMWILSLLTIIATYSLVHFTGADYVADETSLIEALKSNCSVDARPENITQVLTYVLVYALNTVDIEKEVMSLSGLLYAGWKDPRLTWDPSVTGIKKVVMKTKHVWTPPLVVENEITNVGVLGSDGVPLRVMYDGTIKWTPPISTSTSCSADITFYPYDKQTCTLTLTGWSYTIDEVDLVTDPTNHIDLTYYAESGEWDLLNKSYEIQELGDGVNFFRKIHFKITFRRKWPFYGQNVILPIVLNSVLMAMVFAVPIESGEKMGYCLTVLLSYIVLLTMVSDDLPALSNQTSVVQTYLSIVLCIGTTSIICTIGVLRVYNHDESVPISDVLQKLTKYVLAPLVCKSCTKNRVASPEISDKFPVKKDRMMEHLYSPKEMAVILDTFFFRIFSGTLMIITMSFISVLLVNYNSYI